MLLSFPSSHSHYPLATWLHRSSTFLSPFQKLESFRNSQSLSNSVQMNSVLFCSADRRKGKGGKDCLWIATYMDGIMSEMRSLWIGEYRRYSHSFTLRLGLQTCKVHFKNLLYKWHYRKTVTASHYIAFDFRIRWFSLQGTGFFWSIVIQPW